MSVMHEHTQSTLNKLLSGPMCPCGPCSWVTVRLDVTIPTFWFIIPLTSLELDTINFHLVYITCWFSVED